MKTSFHLPLVLLTVISAGSASACTPIYYSAAIPGDGYNPPADHAYVYEEVHRNVYIKERHQEQRPHVHENGYERGGAVLEGTRWTFRSSVWNGEIEFLEHGRYHTAWGYGHWVMKSPEVIELSNDYDPFHHEFVFNTEMDHYRGQRSDGIVVEGRLIARRPSHG